MEINVDLNRAKIKDYLVNYCGNIAGLQDLLDMLDRTDFYTAPASTKYHLAQPGGGAYHSLRVFYGLLQFIVIDSYSGESPYDRDLIIQVVDKLLEGIPLDKLDLSVINEAIAFVYGEKVDLSSICICGLLHDCHKINLYELIEKSVYKGLDERGKKIWETEKAYKVRDDALVFGESGSTSNYIITSCMKLSYEEMLAIENHHGMDRNQNFTPSSSQAWSKSKLALYLHLADMKAAFTEDRN